MQPPFARNVPHECDSLAVEADTFAHHALRAFRFAPARLRWVVAEHGSAGRAAPIPLASPEWTDESSALVTLVVRPDRWSEVTSTVSALFGDSPPNDVAALLATQPEEVLALESRRWSEAAAGLTHVDRTRPVIFRLFEPRVSGLAEIVRTLDGPDTPPVRHVVLVPSADPTALASELLGRLACHADGASHLCDRHRLTLAPREGELVIVIGGEARDVATRSAFERDPGATPLAIELRAELLRDVGVGHGAAMVRRALGGVSSEDQALLQLAGLAELTSAYGRTSPYDRELGVLRLWVEPRVGIRFDAHLTELGVTRIGQASGSPSAPTTPEPTPGAVHVRTRLPIDAIRESAPAPFGYRGIQTTGDLARAVQSCGITCYWQALSAPFAYAALLRQVGADLPEPLTVVVDPSMPIGALDVEVDVRGLGESMRARELVELSERVPTLHVRSRVRGAHWVGVMSHDASATAGEPPAGAPLASPSPDEASLVCLERLGGAVSEGLHAWTRVDPSRSEAVARVVRAEADVAAACVRDPTLLGERDAWLEVLGRLPAGVR